MKSYLLALDQGTTSSRAILFDRNQTVVGMVSREFPQIYPQEGWVEHNPEDIWTSVSCCMTEVLARTGVRADEIAAIGITNQRETTIVWNRTTGQPIANAIVWQCRRTAPMIEALAEQHAVIRRKTGLIPDAYFSASKIRWLLDHVDGARKAAEAGELAFGTVDSWLLYRLTGKHLTDRTNASRTMLYNIDECRWDDGLLKLFDIPASMLPEVKCSSAFYGMATLDEVEIPVCGVAGDQQAALFGQGCFAEGDAKNTYGTGCFLLMNTGEKRLHSENGLLSTIAATTAGEPVQYALEGSVFSGGSVIQWLRDELRLFSDARDAEYLASKVPDSGGVYLVPAFTGLGAPYWDMYARAAIVGMTRGTKREHIIRAAEEAIAYQSADLLSAMQRDLGGHSLTALKVDGGATRDSLLLQFQSDILGLPVMRPVVRETTALGAAALAGLAIGFWKSKEEFAAMWKCDRVFEPAMEKERVQKLLDGWHHAVKQTMA